MPDLSPQAQALLVAFDDRYELCGPFDDWQELCLAAALRALTKTTLVGEAEVKGWWREVISVEDILDIAAEIENK